MKPMVQRKQKGRSQAGGAETGGTNLSQRSKKPTHSKWSKWELLAMIVPVLLLLYILLCYENFHFHVAHMYAHLGYPNAQHIVGQRYLQGTGVEKNEEMAMHWFREAAEQGHPHSSFNLAVGKLKNMTMSLDKGEVENLLSVAAGHGLQEAQELLDIIIRNRNLP
ncbi:secretory immunoglobulin A-binding protein EsiB-like [Trachemys scripta elegans]|nr:secretory immunoglobulin A-binding protein EsiB-like [Chrysemys picta bellii]XP_034628837.1 secretory immunoglobulin A-binding protein EsiB-like [Trachemys scripta elegans]XP_053886568.1 secretory immunoglobulin A-binding protein EsiB-like [Malaclemys terrapin pileata]